MLDEELCLLSVTMCLLTCILYIALCNERFGIKSLIFLLGWDSVEVLLRGCAACQLCSGDSQVHRGNQTDDDQLRWSTDDLTQPLPQLLNSFGHNFNNLTKSWLTCNTWLAICIPTSFVTTIAAVICCIPWYNCCLRSLLFCCTHKCWLWSKSVSLHNHVCHCAWTLNLPSAAGLL